MATLTDPACELGELATKLAVGSGDKGAQFLATQFGVEPWSTEFMRIVACIMERADLVARTVSASSYDQNIKENALQHITKFKEGFGGPSLLNAWNTAGRGITAMESHGKPIQFLSQVVRPVVQYPRLTENEVSELLGLIDTYLQALDDNDDAPAFVRQSIKDGLTVFRFQLENLGWMGSGYALAAFREVVVVYEMSKQKAATLDDPDVGELLTGLLSILRSFKTKVDEAAGWTETAKNVWAAYGIVTGVATPLILTGQVPLLTGS